MLTFRVDPESGDVTALASLGDAAALGSLAAYLCTRAVSSLCREAIVAAGVREGQESLAAETIRNSDLARGGELVVSPRRAFAISESSIPLNERSA
jgi:hypothetical protein